MAAEAKGYGADTADMSLNVEKVNIDKYRRLVRTYIDLQLYKAAQFWADKVLSLTDTEEPEDVYWLAHCMFLMKKYHRAAHLIRSRGLEKKSMPCHGLVAKCLLEAKEPADALLVLEETEFEANETTTNFTFTSFNSNQTSFFNKSSRIDHVEGISKLHSTALDRTSAFASMEEGAFISSAIDTKAQARTMKSSILFLKGNVFESMDNRGLASECFKQALCEDVHNYEAFEALIQHQMLTAWEEHDLLASLPTSNQCSPAEEQLQRQLYESKLKKYDSPAAVANISLADIYPNLATNLDLIVSQAERHYYNCNYRECFRITEEVLRKDPYHEGCLPVHIACLVELKKVNQLFYLAHRLVDLFPEMALAWFAVGCYYYTISKSDPARRYLAKATSLDRLFGPAWIAYGHSFAAENEHDQAMAAYFKASQLMKGCHLPLLYIGLECGLGNNVKLADKFFLQAQTIAPDDPFVFHEMGVTAFQNLEFETAERHFTNALNRIRTIDNNVVAEKWEPLLNNLGHVCRKLGRFPEALEYHQQALVLSPLNPSTYSAIGYVHALDGNTEQAVDAFHKALGIRRDDTFSTTMLSYVIEQLMEEQPAFAGAPDETPRLVPLSSTSGAGEPVKTTAAAKTTATAVPARRERLFFDTFSDSSASMEPNASSSVAEFEVEMQDASPPEMLVIENVRSLQR